MQTVICMKWGTRYGPHFVNRLYEAIKKNTIRDTRLVCFTDDGTGIVPDVQIEPIPEINLPPDLIGTPWRKLTVWKAPLADLSGDILFLDLDLVITGSIDALFDFEPGRFCVIENWTQLGQGIGNTSVFRFPVGKYKWVYDRIQADPVPILEKYEIEQQYITLEIDDMAYWPEKWCVSFKHNLLPKWPLNFFISPKLPTETKLVAFTGKPDQDEALEGKWPEPRLWKRLYKHVRPTPWIAEHW